MAYAPGSSSAPGFPPAAAAPPGFAADAAPPATPTSGFHPEEKAFPIATTHNQARSIFAFADPVVQPLATAIARLQESRQKLALPNPGTTENLTKEVRSTHLTNFFFDGGRADLTKALSMNPIAQITHSFTYGAQGQPPSYNFGAIYGDDKHFMQGSIDDNFSVTGRFNRAWVPGHTSKVQAQLAPVGGQTFVQLEHDFQGLDHTINVKAINPSPAEGTGMFNFSFLQSLTRNFALGLETVHVRQGTGLNDSQTGYVAKYTSDARDAIATLQIQPQGLAQATYWQRLAEKVDAAVDLQCITAQGRREAMATVGAKWDFRMSTVRAQVDSTGKLSSLWEQRIAPAFSWTVAMEVDHLKQAARFGLGVSIESTTQDMSAYMDPNAQPPSQPNVPM